MYNYSWCLTIATIVAAETNETIDHIIWNMPLAMTFKLVAITHSMKTGEKVLDHTERKVTRRQQEAFAEHYGNQ